MSLHAMENAAHIMEPDDAPKTQEEQANWKIRDKQHADWVMRQLGSLTRRRQENLDLYEHENTRLADWLAGENQPLEEEIRFRQQQLAEFMLEERSADPNVKSISLPAGKIKSRIAGAGTIVVEDEEAFVEWCETNDHHSWVKVRKSVARSVVTSEVQADLPPAGAMPSTVPAFDENGERIPGLSVSTGSYTVTVEASKS